MVTRERGAALSPPDSSLRGGENVTQSTRRGEKVLCQLLPGNFNWALKCFFSFDNIFLLSFFFFFAGGCFNRSALLSAVVVPAQQRRPLQLDIYTEGSQRATCHSSRCLRLLSFITSTLVVETAVLRRLWRG